MPTDPHLVPEAEPVLEVVKAERDEALRKLNATERAWDATFKTKDALALIAIEEDVLKVVRVYLTTLTDVEREKFFYEVERGYCTACGRKLDDAELSGCQCTNDE